MMVIDGKFCRDVACRVSTLFAKKRNCAMSVWNKKLRNSFKSALDSYRGAFKYNIFVSI